MTRMTGPDCAVMCNLINIHTYIHTYTYIYFPCSADQVQDWQPYPVDSYSAICDDHTYIHILHTYYIHTIQQVRAVVKKLLFRLSRIN